MTPFVPVYTAEAKHRIRHLPPVTKQQIRSALEGLQENPYEGKALQRELIGRYSLRVKNYRIIYQVDENSRRLRVLTLGPRQTIYDDMRRRL